jgi:hypothetical protein
VPGKLAGRILNCPKCKWAFFGRPGRSPAANDPPAWQAGLIDPSEPPARRRWPRPTPAAPRDTPASENRENRENRGTTPPPATVPAPREPAPCSPAKQGERGTAGPACDRPAPPPAAPLSQALPASPPPARPPAPNSGFWGWVKAAAALLLLWWACSAFYAWRGRSETERLAKLLSEEDSAPTTWQAPATAPAPNRPLEGLAWRGQTNFQVRGTGVYLAGATGLPQYEIRGTLIYRTVHHPRGLSGSPDYEARGSAVYRTTSHPDGLSALPVGHLRR